VVHFPGLKIGGGCHESLRIQRLRPDFNAVIVNDDLLHECVEVVFRHRGVARNKNVLNHLLEVLPEIKAVIGNRIPILADSGFRRGSDVMKALALGADAVLCGWSFIMGLAAGGSQGVHAIIEILTGELRRIMSVTGCRNPSEIGPEVLIQRDFLPR